MSASITAAPLSAGQRVALHYFVAAMVLFFAQILFGIIAGLQYLNPDLFYNQLDFSVTRMVHINAMVVWLLFGFMGAVYWLVEDEAGTELVGAKLAQLNFWVLAGAVSIVVLVYLFVQIGPGERSSIWLINEGREYIEAPRWADIGIVVDGQCAEADARSTQIAGFPGARHHSVNRPARYAGQGFDRLFNAFATELEDSADEDDAPLIDMKGVGSGGGLVEDEDGRIDEEGSSDCDALRLTTRGVSILPDDGIEASG